MSFVKFSFVGVSFCIIVHLHSNFAFSNSFREAKFYQMDRTRMVGNVTNIIRVKDVLDCATFCLTSTAGDCYSFNFGKTAINGLYTCEVSNSERRLDPASIPEMSDFKCYGFTAESLFRFLPYASSPCHHSKESIAGQGQFQCKCPLEDIGLRFIDDFCTVDMKQIVLGNKFANVSYVAVRGYTVNYFEAENLCRLVNASGIASYDQLHAAWEAGLQVCERLWLRDATVGYAMQEPKAGCGNRKGVINGNIPKDKLTSRFNVWCYFQN